SVVEQRFPMKIYTKTGDDGSTGLVGGQRVRKCDCRIACVGAVDELNASIGLAGVIADDSLRVALREIQNELFVIGSQLASADGQVPSTQHIPMLHERMISRLETQIDASESRLPA